MTSPRLAYRRPEPPRTRMHRTSLAPVLSATLHRVSCWITVLLLGTPTPSGRRRARESALPGRSAAACCLPGPSLGPLQHLDHAPALRLRQGPGLHDPDLVTDLRVVR